MQVLTDNQSAIWCLQRGFKLNGKPYWNDHRVSNGVRYVTTSKQSVVEAFVRYVINGVKFDEAVVWLTDWPLYKSDEMAVMARFRASIGEERRFIDTPGHIFGTDEVDDCVGLFLLCVHYLWDAFLFVPEGRVVAYSSHDGFLYMSSLSDEGRAELRTHALNFQS